MVSQFLMIFTLISIWISLIWGVVILVSAVHFWLKHSDFKVDKEELPFMLAYGTLLGAVREHDFIGELEISDNFYYGIQTFRATENFHMSGRTLKEYPYFVKAFAQIKKAAALAYLRRYKAEQEAAKEIR